MATRTTDKIQKTIVLKTPRSRVWKAVATASQFGEWFGVRLDGEFEPGKPITGSMAVPGYDGPFEIDIEEVEPETLFSFRWHPFNVDPALDLSGEPKTLVTFRLDDHPDGTLLTITETGFDALPPERRRAAFDENSQGWDIQSERIARYVDQPA